LLDAPVCMSVSCAIYAVKSKKKESKSRRGGRTNTTEKRERSSQYHIFKKESQMERKAEIGQTPKNTGKAVFSITLRRRGENKPIKKG